MFLTNTESIPGKTLEALGLVKGSTVQSKNFVKDFGQGLKSIVGGELKSYTQMMEEAREIATQRMVADAKSLNADAIVNIRYASSAIMASAAEIMVYGTAVKYK